MQTVEERREYMREYTKRRSAEDPVFVEARKKRAKEWYEKKKYDPEFRAKRTEASLKFQRTEAGKRRKLHWKLMGAYGISIEEYETLNTKQNGLCAICKQPQRPVRKNNRMITRLAVDHNHATKENRGLLCSDCNPALGGFKDSPKLLRTAAEYLESYGKVE